MIRRVIPGREKEALAFLEREPEVNHFILGDIECFSLFDPNLSLWVEDRCGITAALLRYYGSFIIYAPGGIDYRHAARVVRDCGFGMLSGRPEYLNPLIEQLGMTPHINANVLMRLKPGGLHPVEKGMKIIQLKMDNLEQYIQSIVELRQSIAEFSVGINVEALKDELKIGCKRVLVAMEGDRAVSMVMTTVERKNAAMIVSVCTREECRGQGFAGALMSQLCRELEGEGKTGVLFYSNPVAGRIYTSLGFEDIGRWCFATFN